ncbi:TTLL5 [Bugula neritina]|uniref:TTLL5 n=1 Tax=Bugula neritina TaxID=10212 RepID=A0A7J7IRR8_BUGNE|nr:TTLL5 [Bugula neritina]
MSETSKNMGEEDLEIANDQMVCFLLRSRLGAQISEEGRSNLMQPFKVVVPARRLPLNDRRRILAKQLGDFVHIYSKETDNLHTASSRRDFLAIANDRRIGQSQTEEFVSSASEIELEQVLTTYTKINKSASIFLGSKKTESTNSNTSTGQGRPVTSQKQANNMHGVIVNGAEGTGTWRDDITNSPKSSSVSTHSDMGADIGLKSRDPSTSAVAKSSFQNAVYIYSGKMSSTQPRQRPSSALSASRTASTTSLRNRPSSASLNRPQQMPENVVKSAFEDSMEDVNQALQELTTRQQERNYYTSNVPRTGKMYPSDKGKQTSVNDSENSKRSRHSSARYRVAELEEQSRLRTRRGSAGDPTASVNGTGDSTTSPYSSDLAADAYSRVTGVTPSSQFKPSRQSAQFAMLKQSEFDKQEQLMQQSKALLEASKAKHQAMVAQAHAATKRVQDYESGGISYAPRPPRSPPTKPATAHPHRNISRYPATLVKSHSQDDLSHDFYSNVRYDTATGKAKLMRPVP